MTVVASYAPFGTRPCYYAAAGTAYGPTIESVLKQQSAHSRWDLCGVKNYLDRSPDGWRTCFADIHAVPPETELVVSGDRCTLRAATPPSPSWTSLPETLEQAVANLVSDGRRTAVALSGGLDSALLVALLRRIGRDDIPVFTLTSGLPGYCERSVTECAAAMLGVQQLQVIETNAMEMVSAFPAVIAAAEVPLFNLHPVNRWLLSRALQREGYEVLLTGDGADQVFAGSDPRNYLPIIGALTRAAGLELRSPFFNEQVMACAHLATPEKTLLRQTARQWLPKALFDRPKSATYAPELDVREFWNEPAIQELAAQLHVGPVHPNVNAQATLWTSLGLLANLIN